MGGKFFIQHKDDILNLVRNTEKREKMLHPMERIMNITENGSETVVTATGIHVARRIGEAVAKAFKGDFSFRYGNGEQSVAIRWSR